MSFSRVIRKGFKFIINSDYRFIVLAERGFYNKLDDKTYLERMYKARHGKELDLEHPNTYNEKLQWLKLYDRRPKYTDMVDKDEAKRYVAKKIGDQYIIPTLGIYEKFDDIDFDALPDEFVLKTTHDSGTVIICRDKKSLDYVEAKKKLEKSLARNFFWYGREWPYKNVKPQIIAEEFLSDLGTDKLTEYKVFCFNGKPHYVLVCTGGGHGADRTNDFYDMDFSHINVKAMFPNAKIAKCKPQEFDEIIGIATRLSVGIPQVRVDLYDVEGTLYFGELTLFHDSGYCVFDPSSFDEQLGTLIELPNKE